MQKVFACVAGGMARLNFVPAPSHVIGFEPDSPGENESFGVAVTVTHSPPPQPESVTTPVQLLTETNTGTPMIDGVPSGGEATTAGAANVPSIRIRIWLARSLGGMAKTH